MAVRYWVGGGYDALHRVGPTAAAKVEDPFSGEE
jgi:hypothetical protein